MRSESVHQNEYYHIYNRGVAKEPIFFRPNHWLFFIKKMKKYFRPESVDMLAYCLMPNPYHFMIYTKTEDFGKKVMMPMMISYSKSVNQDILRVGPLFQGAFKAKPIKTTEQLIHLSRYIHLNPVKAGMVNKPEEWKFSSYLDYAGLRNGSLPKTDIVLSDFITKEEYTAYVNAGVGEEDISELMFNEN